MREVLTDPSVADWGLLDGPAVEAAMDAHIAGTADHGMILKKLVILCLWHQHVKTPTPAPV